MEPDTNDKKSNLTKNFKVFLSNGTIEPIMVLYYLSHTISVIATQNLVLEKGCRVNLALGEDICNALSTRNMSYPDYKVYEKQVQSLAANMFIWRDILISGCPTFLMLFIGSWSDKYNKRKQLILNVIFADIITTIIYILSTYFFKELPLEVNILGDALLQGISGGMMVAQVGTLGYIVGITTEKNRTHRMGYVNFLLSISICLGLSLGGILYQSIKFYGVFSITLFLYTIALLYGIYFVKDIWQYEAEKGVVYTKTHKYFLQDFFDFANAYKTITFLFSKREGSGRKQIWLVLILTLLIMGPYRGEANVSYYYTRYKFGWSPVKYSMFNTLEAVTVVIGNLVALLVFIKIFKIHDCLMGIISCTIKILVCLIYAFGPTSTYLYCGAVLNLFRDISLFALKCFASKLVSPEEFGKLFSITTLVETFAPVIYCSMYNKIYAVTLDNFPGTFYILSAASCLTAILIFGLLYYEWVKEQRDAMRNKSTLINTVNSE